MRNDDFQIRETDMFVNLVISDACTIQQKEMPEGIDSS